MFIIKKNYYLYIDNTKSINLNLIKSSHKFVIIYRSVFFKENILFKLILEMKIKKAVLK